MDAIQTHKGGAYLSPPHPHTHKTETKRTIKIKNPKNNIEKTKGRERRKQIRKNKD